MSFIAVTSWGTYQHYKDRDPPWIKLYRDLLTSESWVLGTDTSRLVQVASILLAARYGNRIPYRWDLIKKVASLECTEKAFNEAIKHLAVTGFLELQEVTSGLGATEQDASNALATCAEQNSALYSEAEQSRAETEQRQTRPRERASTPLVLHESLPSEEWGQWMTLRMRKRWPVDDLTLRKQLEILAEFDTPTQRKMLNNSIQSSWQGLFPLKGINGAPRKAFTPAPTTAELEAQEAARGTQ